MRILFVDDDERLAGLVRRGLSESGHVVDCAPTGGAGIRFATERSYDAIVLDVMMPEVDGFAVVRSLRESGLTTPVLFLTARDAPMDTIAGLDAGADDYLRKPFVFGELEARLRSIARRTAPPRDPLLTVADLTFDIRTRSAKRGLREIDLSARESAFLEYFMHNAGRVMTRAMIQDALWTVDKANSSNVVDVYVRRLRAKLEAGGEARLLHTLRGAGYRLEAPRR
jgi:two-component system copper resistance phosphate regulon response regulator CusR